MLTLDNIFYGRDRGLFATTKRQHVPQDYVEAYKWLDLAVPQASGRQCDDSARICNAVAASSSEPRSGDGVVRPAP
jgi:TPR repeat protein